jgi:hypothetical protein
MPREQWGALSPDVVSESINFDRTDPGWSYTSSQIGMPARQAEGVAGVWNRLAMHGLALLADEVGMGKTYQALGVIALLWKMKPDARVLIMAPNQVICSNWMNEYSVFIERHYRAAGDGLKDSAGAPAREPVWAPQMDTLVQQVNTGPGALFLTTIHALSGLVHDKQGDIGEKAARAAQQIHDALTKNGARPAFDLIVVDEAHYFRRANGESQRAKAARKFFGDGHSRLGDRALLLTATPSHSSLDDVGSILGYFADLGLEGAEPPTPAKILARYAIRRLRLMQGLNGQHHSKQSYRRELALPAGFDGMPHAELFFALYQKILVQQRGLQGNKRGYLYGYLEGFESLGQHNDREDASHERPEKEAPGEVHAAGTDPAARDFRGAPDTAILQELTCMYHKRLGRFPEHPKYGVIVDACTPEDVFGDAQPLHDHKHLVFVRRIPSVRELTQRTNAAYDEMFAQRIVQAWGLAKPQKVLEQWRAQQWSRRFFNRLLKSRQLQGSPTLADIELLDDPAPGTDTDESAPAERQISRIADLFVTRRTELVASNRSTDCSNFRLRLQKHESILWLLLEPALDYRAGTYRTYYRKQAGERIRDDYGTAAIAARLHGIDQAGQSHEGEYETHEYREPMPTLWGLMHDLLPDGLRERIEGWLASTDGWKACENFARYVRTGWVYASPVIIELYAWFVEFTRFESAHGSAAGDPQSDAQQRYLALVRWVTPRLPSSLIYRYFVSALESFEQLCETVPSLSLKKWDQGWSRLASLHSPAWFASGETSHRERLILGFNSPFYPNVLVATSVFQEGVNLHLQCRNVHHYGIAWTPGDNEQRVGRVDRLFGRINHELMLRGQTELTISYPYLEKSFDQEQLASFVRLKHEVEARMDACRHIEFDDAIDMRHSNDGWESYLRRPGRDEHAADPFPAHLEPGLMPTFPYAAYQDPRSRDAA